MRNTLQGHPGGWGQLGAGNGGDCWGGRAGLRREDPSHCLRDVGQARGQPGTDPAPGIRHLPGDGDEGWGVGPWVGICIRPMGLVRGLLMTLNTRFSSKTHTGGSEPKYLNEPRNIAQAKIVSHRTEKSRSS